MNGLRRFPTRKLLSGLGIALRSLALTLVLSGLGLVPGLPVRSEAATPVEQESSQDVVETAVTALRRVQLPRPVHVSTGTPPEACDISVARSPRHGQSGRRLLAALTLPLRC